MQLNLLVLRCENIEISKGFYEKLGLKFEKEQHGKGAVHYSTKVGDLIMELYPLIGEDKIENSRLGFSLEGEDIVRLLEKNKIVTSVKYEFDSKQIFVVIDPDRRKVELQ